MTIADQAPPRSLPSPCPCSTEKQWDREGATNAHRWDQTLASRASDAERGGPPVCPLWLSPAASFYSAAGQPAASITFRSVVAHEFRFIATPICADCVPRTMGCVRTEYLSARRDSALVVRVKAAVCRAAVVGTPGDRFH